MNEFYRELFHYAAACFMLVFGCLLCLLSLYIPPRGIIDSSVLWVLGQSIVFAGSIFGVKSYVDFQISKRKNDDSQTTAQA